MEKQAKIYIAGHSGLIGRALLRELKRDGFSNLLTRSRKELDLTRQREVESFFDQEQPDYVILAAARVGGIKANISFPAEFIYENLAIQTNIINSAYLAKVKKLLFFGTACSYPRDAQQPMKEDYLLSGKLEPTNEAYAVAKISGIKMVESYRRQYGVNFISALLTNAYGCDDHFDSDDSHVIPALIKRFHQAKVSGESSLSIWGTGNPQREFIFADDAARGVIFLIDNYDQSEIINLGTGQATSIKELSLIIKKVVGYRGEIIFDSSKPDGAPCKVLDLSKLSALGWQASVSLEEGIKKTYESYINRSSLSVAL